MTAPDLTTGERLEIQRRRDRLTQPEAAERLSVSTHLYRRWERDLGRRAPIVDVGPLEAREWAWLMRRREGLTRRQLSDLTGLHPQWIHLAENGEGKNPEPLVEWWERRLADRILRGAALHG